jgi:hypothetical protein
MHYPYKKQKSLLSEHEAAFFKELKVLADSKGLLVFPKVRLADLVWVPRTYGLYELFFRRIKARHIDFVLCEPYAFKVVCLIELDGISHDLPQQHSQDKFKDKVIKAAGYNFIRCSSPEHVCNLI